jgi:hypothetical protein
VCRIAWSVPFRDMPLVAAAAERDPTGRFRRGAYALGLGLRWDVVRLDLDNRLAPGTVHRLGAGELAASGALWHRTKAITQTRCFDRKQSSMLTAGWTNVPLHVRSAPTRALSRTR